MSETKSHDRQSWHESTRPDPGEYDEASRADHPAVDYPAMDQSTANPQQLAGTVALLRFDIGAARAAIRYRDDQIAALEARLREALQPGDQDGLA